MKKLMLVFLMMLVTSNNHVFSNMPEPYNSINMLRYDDQGWLSPENKKKLKEFIEEAKPKIVIELGSWIGKSATFMAEILSDDAKLYAIDHWGPSFEDAHKEAVLKAKLPHVYQLFLSNIMHKGMQHKVIPVRMHTREAAQALNVIADLIYIDAGHREEEVYHDILDWYPHLAQGGRMCGDDWHWKTVRAGVERAAQALHQTISTEGTFWWFELKS